MLAKLYTEVDCDWCRRTKGDPQESPGGSVSAYCVNMSHLLLHQIKLVHLRTNFNQVIQDSNGGEYHFQGQNYI